MCALSPRAIPLGKTPHPPSGSRELGLVIRHHLLERFQTFGADLGHGSLDPSNLITVFGLVDGDAGIATAENGRCSKDLKRTRGIAVGAARANLDFLAPHDPSRTAFVH